MYGGQNPGAPGYPPQPGYPQAQPVHWPKWPIPAAFLTHRPPHVYFADKMREVSDVCAYVNVHA